MNTSKFARVTLVLERGTADDLDYLSDRLGFSRSELAREALTVPLRVMRQALGEVPAGEADPRQIALVGLDVLDHAKAALLDAPVAELRRIAHGG